MTVFDVGKPISQLKNKECFGNDIVSPFFLKLASPYIAESLTFIYNLAIGNGTFPAEGKIAKVIPLPKTKDLSDPNNFSLSPSCRLCLSL